MYHNVSKFVIVCNQVYVFNSQVISSLDSTATRHNYQFQSDTLVLHADSFAGESYESVKLISHIFVWDEKNMPTHLGS